MDYFFRQIGQGICNKLLLESDVIENLLNTQDHYDLMITHIMSGDCLLILAYILKIPATIGVITSPTLAWSADRFGYPNTPSYIPDILLTYNGQRMSFVERLWNTFYYFHHKFKLVVFLTYFLIMSFVCFKNYGCATTSQVDQLQNKVRQFYQKFLIGINENNSISIFFNFQY